MFLSKKYAFLGVLYVTGGTMLGGITGCGPSDSTSVIQQDATQYPTIDVKVNGNTISKFVNKGRVVNGHTYIQWGILQVLKASLGTQYEYHGNGFFTIDNRKVQGIIIDGHTYLKWSEILPGKLIPNKTSNGWNFTFSAPERPTDLWKIASCTLTECSDLGATLGNVTKVLGCVAFGGTSTALRGLGAARAIAACVDAGSTLGTNAYNFQMCIEKKCL